MRDFLILFVHLIVTAARLARPGGLRSVVAESVLVRHQLLGLNRGRKRAPKLRTPDRIIAGLCALFMRRARLLRSAIVLKPATLLHFHSVLKTRKYRMLFSQQRGRRPGPKGPKKDLIDAVVAMKRHNPSWGCPRIAQQIALAFGVDIDKDVVRRLLRVHYRPESNSGGPSWLTFIGHMKDSLWSCDLFRCESATLRTHWVLVVMDQFTRRVIGFGVHGGIVDGVALCGMFQRAIRGHSLPKYLSSVGSRTGAVLQRSGLSVSPCFLWECLISRTVSPFPVPAASNPPCGFPAVGFPVCFALRSMGRLALDWLSGIAVSSRGGSH